MAKIKYAGGRNFIVENYDDQGEQIDLLVNTIGKYEGTVPFDFRDDEQTTRLSVESSGEWEIQILPLDQIRVVEIPGTFEGNGDDVVLFKGTNPDLLKVDASNAKRNFVIYSYQPLDYDLAVNEIAPYTGVVIVPRNTFLLVIMATGPWSIEVTTK